MNRKFHIILECRRLTIIYIVKESIKQILFYVNIFSFHATKTSVSITYISTPYNQYKVTDFSSHDNAKPNDLLK